MSDLTVSDFATGSSNFSWFGHSIVTYGDLVAVGSPEEQTDGLNAPGKVTLMTLEGGRGKKNHVDI